jgi:hypothetical protein
MHLAMAIAASALNMSVSWLCLLMLQPRVLGLWRLAVCADLRGFKQSLF